MNGYIEANYVERGLDIATVLHALGMVWDNRVCPDDVAQEAANLYYRLKNRFITENYTRPLRGDSRP